MAVLQTEKIITELGSASKWQVKNAKLVCQFKFKDFKEAIGFVNKVAELSESVNHHPDMVIEYNKVTLKLWTHAKRGITDKDLAMAKEIDAIINSFKLC